MKLFKIILFILSASVAINCLAADRQAMDGDELTSLARALWPNESEEFIQQTVAQTKDIEAQLSQLSPEERAQEEQKMFEQLNEAMGGDFQMPTAPPAEPVKAPEVKVSTKSTAPKTKIEALKNVIEQLVVGMEIFTTKTGDLVIKSGTGDAITSEEWLELMDEVSTGIQYLKAMSNHEKILTIMLEEENLATRALIEKAAPALAQAVNLINIPDTMGLQDPVQGLLHDQLVKQPGFVESVNLLRKLLVSDKLNWNLKRIIEKVSPEIIKKVQANRDRQTGQQYMGDGPGRYNAPGGGYGGGGGAPAYPGGYDDGGGYYGGGMPSYGGAPHGQSGGYPGISTGAPQGQQVAPTGNAKGDGKDGSSKGAGKSGSAKSDKDKDADKDKSDKDKDKNKKPGEEGKDARTSAIEKKWATVSEKMDALNRLLVENKTTDTLKELDHTTKGSTAAQLRVLGSTLSRAVTEFSGSIDSLIASSRGAQQYLRMYRPQFNALIKSKSALDAFITMGPVNLSAAIAAEKVKKDGSKDATIRDAADERTEALKNILRSVTTIKRAIAGFEQKAPVATVSESLKEIDKISTVKAIAPKATSGSVKLDDDDDEFEDIAPLTGAAMKTILDTRKNEMVDLLEKMEDANAQLKQLFDGKTLIDTIKSEIANTDSVVHPEAQRKYENAKDALLTVPNDVQTLSEQADAFAGFAKESASPADEAEYLQSVAKYARKTNAPHLASINKVKTIKPETVDAAIATQEKKFSDAPADKKAAIHKKMKVLDAIDSILVAAGTKEPHSWAKQDLTASPRVPKHK